jgi:Phage integrase family
MTPSAYPPAPASRPPTATLAAIASIAPKVNFHILRHTHGSHLAMNGVPMGVIAAQLGHADTRMTEKHYAHLAPPSYVAQTIRANFPDLGIGSGSRAVGGISAGHGRTYLRTVF